ncbi:sigma factor-like helix-turn-helix DNA-binding protein [Oscillospiraceae bacterium PP1C4]
MIKQFQPLLNKYSRKLNYEDSFSDLQIKLIEVIKNMKLMNLKNTEDPYLLSYIKKCMEHYFFKLSQKQRDATKIIPLSAFDQEEGEDQRTYFLDKLLSVSDEYFQIEYDALFRLLTRREAETIIYFYYFHYPVKEIAQYYHVSMPAISQIKANAIKKLKKSMLTENL